MMLAALGETKQAIEVANLALEITDHLREEIRRHGQH